MSIIKLKGSIDYSCIDEFTHHSFVQNQHKNIFMTFCTEQSGITSTNVYYYDVQSLQYIKVWNFKGKYCKSHVRDIIHIQFDIYIILFHYSNDKCSIFEAYELNCTLRSFTKTYQIRAQDTYYELGYIFIQNQSILQIINLAENPIKVTIELSIINKYELLQYKDTKILYIYYLDGIYQKFHLAPQFKKFTIHENSYNFINKIVSFFLIQILSGEIVKLSLRLKQGRAGLYLDQSKIFSIRPNMKILRCLQKEYTKWMQLPKFIICTNYDLWSKDIGVYNVTNGQQTQLIHGYMNCYENSIIEHAKDQGQIKVYEIQIE